MIKIDKAKKPRFPPDSIAIDTLTTKTNKRKKKSSPSVVLLVLDWDETITSMMGLSQERSDTIAIKLKMLKPYCILIILSLATRAWIDSNIEKSQSKLLNQVLKNVIMITEDERHPKDNNRIWPLINKERGESQRDMAAMILAVTRDPKNRTDEACIYAYKKTNSLIRLSNEYKIPHDQIYFLDNNKENIEFALANGFQAFLVNNNPSAIHSSLEYYLDELLLRFQGHSSSSTITK